jgi:copper chaperone CopZ
MKYLTILLALFFFSGSALAADPFDEEKKEKKEKKKEMVLNVSGMVCGVCEDKVSTELKALDGVEEVEASHENNEVRIILAAEHASEEELSEAVKKAGFKVVKDDAKKERKKREDG